MVEKQEKKVQVIEVDILETKKDDLRLDINSKINYCEDLITTLRGFNETINEIKDTKLLADVIWDYKRFLEDKNMEDLE